MHSSFADSTALPKMPPHEALSPKATKALLPWKLLAQEMRAAAHGANSRLACAQAVQAVA